MSTAHAAAAFTNVALHNSSAVEAAHDGSALHAPRQCRVEHSPSADDTISSMLAISTSMESGLRTTTTPLTWSADVDQLLTELDGITPRHEPAHTPLRTAVPGATGRGLDIVPTDGPR